jgi:hypothetical protein
MIVLGSEALGCANSEHDVKVYSVFSKNAHKSTGWITSSSITAAPLPTDTEWVKTSIQLNRHLSSVDRYTIGHQPPSTYPLNTTSLFSWRID